MSLLNDDVIYDKIITQFDSMDGTIQGGLGLSKQETALLQETLLQ